MRPLGLANQRAIVFDGDDTLWNTQELYDAAKANFYELIAAEGYDATDAEARLAEIEAASVARLGYSRERFPLSMRQTYELLCRASGEIPRPGVAEAAELLGRAVFDAAPTVRAGAPQMLAELRREFRLLLFTAGDEEVQQSRIESSGLAEYFDVCRIASGKSTADWAELVAAERLDARDTWSVGNSVRSDINPAVELGMRCILVTAPTWEYEQVALTTATERGHVWRVDALADAVRVIRSQSVDTNDPGNGREQ